MNFKTITYIFYIFFEIRFQIHNKLDGTKAGSLGNTLSTLGLELVPKGLQQGIF